MDKKLFLLDAYALIYRAYYASKYSPQTTSSGMNTSAIFGFCNVIDEILRKQQPTHIAVCFDPPHGKTFRHAVYQEYKAQRDAQPEDITIAVPYIKQILQARNIKMFEVEGYEADDVVGTIAAMASKQDFTTYMLTSDKDYGQLVNENTFIYRPRRSGGYEVRGVEEIKSVYQINSTEQVIDLLALQGDASDNIPGCPGVGEKTAVKLLSQFGSVENLIENVAQVKGSLQQKIKDNIEQIKFSKFLVTIKTDVPLQVDFDDLKVVQPDVAELKKIYSKLEFRSFLAKLNATSADKVAAQSEKTSIARSDEHATETEPNLFSLFEEDNQQVKNEIECLIIADDEADAFVDDILSTYQKVAIATDSVGAESMTATLKGVALSVERGKAAYLSANPTTLRAFKRLFNSSIMIISHDVKRDYILLHNLSVPFTSSYFDTSVAYYLLQPEKSKSLRDVVYAMLDHEQIEGVENLRDPRQLSTLDSTTRINRHGNAAEALLRLVEPLKTALINEKQEKLFDEVEIPFVTVLADMELEGVRIDTVELNRNTISLTRRIDEMETEIFKIAGHQFNVASPMQVGEVLFGEMKIDEKAKRTKSGAFSTTEEILQHHRSKHRIVDLILKVRGLRKLMSTYITALPNLINTKTGKIHTTFNQTVTATGRISSANPNLQNIPIRTEDGREVRKAFVPDEGCLMLAADYSQIELRIIADLANDPEMIGAFKAGHDIHRATAARIFNEPIDQVTDEHRRKAKTANFGIIYGISAFGLSERLSIPRTEAKQLIEDYFTSFPAIQVYIQNNIQLARQQGYVSTILGRRRFLHDINSRNATMRSFAERNAVNAPIQGSAADIIKIAMIRVAKSIKRQNLRSRMILQVHDELIFNVYPEELEQVKQLVIAEMVGAYIGNVPLEVGVGVGGNWLEAH